MDFHPSERPSKDDFFEFERFDKGYHAEDICCVICGAPSFIVEEEIRDKNLERYKWFVPQAIRAENYQYEDIMTAWYGVASLPNHDFPLEVLGIDDIEIDEIHYGERLSKLEPKRYAKHSSKLVHDLCMEYPYVTVHSECLDMMRRLVDYRQALLKAGVSVGSKHPTTLSQLYEVFEQRITRGCLYNYPLGLNGSFTPRRVVEPHYYYFRDVDIFWDVAWAWGEKKVYEYEMAPSPIPGLTREILSYLQPLPSLQSHSRLFLELEALPTELQDMIYNDLHPFINPQQICNRSLPSMVWRDLLFNRQILPWLWDLDISALQSRPATSDMADVPTFEAENTWDWEHLVRTLAQVEVFEPGHPLEHAPLRLRNRRRIWRLLEEAEDKDIREWVDASAWRFEEG
ncbi:hypothetical protein BDV25DRAFT_165856 [Aspergillus avenaceus]|uniref:F-box domain-containing protein n=1 Tax=Aspergillus avenaceus TaxID=36643 RepID=A0A5N6TEU5_ASPAV|nr:hypothetical protein BDV25DRAFT_165856 [Aspergillus avenaceus]